ncbi:MAG: histidinol-phosphate transaminase [Bacteroidales bacterium]|nr:histidinol-phosphate transaminase [Bacteroidales bacterium]
MNKIESLVRPNIRALCPYSTARDEYQGALGIFLDANESPYPSGYNRYPDPRQKGLKAQLAAIKGVPADSIFLGNGSDEAIDLMFRVFCTPGVDNAVAISPSYGMYTVAADINDIAVRSVLLGEDFSLPTQALLDASDEHTKLLFLCSPNNPSGNAFEPSALEDLIRRFPGIVVLDEAYADFSAKGSLRSRLPEFPNLVILQTLSKAYGLAGLRLGMAFASPYIIRLMSMVKYPYNINQATQELVSKALQSSIDEQVETLVAQRARVAAALPAFSCVKRVYPSDANFLLVQVDDADRLYTHLIADGIIVRNRTRVPLCAGCLRITIGLPSENDRLLQSFEAYEKGDIHR